MRSEISRPSAAPLAAPNEVRRVRSGHRPDRRNRQLKGRFCFSIANRKSTIENRRACPERGPQAESKGFFSIENRKSQIDNPAKLSHKFRASLTAV